MAELDRLGRLKDQGKFSVKTQDKVIWMYIMSLHGIRISPTSTARFLLFQYQKNLSSSASAFLSTLVLPQYA